MVFYTNNWKNSVTTKMIHIRIKSLRKWCKINRSQLKNRPDHVVRRCCQCPIFINGLNLNTPKTTLAENTCFFLKNLWWKWYIKQKQCTKGSSFFIMQLHICSLLRLRIENKHDFFTRKIPRPKQKWWYFVPLD